MLDFLYPHFTKIVWVYSALSVHCLVIQSVPLLVTTATVWNLNVGWYCWVPYHKHFRIWPHPLVAQGSLKCKNREKSISILNISQFKRNLQWTFRDAKYIIWAAAWQNQQSECAPRERLRSAWASVPGWSESSLDTQSLCWFCHVTAHIYQVEQPFIFIEIM